MEESKEFEQSSSISLQGLQSEKTNDTQDVEGKKENVYVPTGRSNSNLDEQDLEEAKNENIFEDPLFIQKSKGKEAAEVEFQTQISNHAFDLSNVETKTNEIEDQFIFQDGAYCIIKNEFMEESLIIESTQYISEDSMDITESLFGQRSTDSTSVGINELLNSFVDSHVDVGSTQSLENLYAEKMPYVNDSDLNDKELLQTEGHIMGCQGDGQTTLSEELSNRNLKKTDNEHTFDDISNISKSSGMNGNQSASDVTIDNLSNNENLSSDLIKPSFNLQLLPLYIQIEKNQDIPNCNEGEGISEETDSRENYDGLLKINTAPENINLTDNSLENKADIEKQLSFGLGILQSVITEQTLNTEYKTGNSESLTELTHGITESALDILNDCTELLIDNQLDIKSLSDNRDSLIIRDSETDTSSFENSLKYASNTQDNLVNSEILFNNSQQFSSDNIASEYTPVNSAESVDECINDSVSSIESTHCINKSCNTSVLDYNNESSNNFKESSSITQKQQTSDLNNDTEYEQKEKLTSDILKNNVATEVSYSYSSNDVSASCEKSSELLSSTQLYSVNLQTDETTELSVNNKLSEQCVQNETDVKINVLSNTSSINGSKCNDNTTSAVSLQSFCLNQPRTETYDADDIDNQTTYSNKDMNITLDVNYSKYDAETVNKTPTDQYSSSQEASVESKSVVCTESPLNETINIECIACDGSLLYNGPTETEDPLKSFCLDITLNPLLLKADDKLPEAKMLNHQFVVSINKIQEEYVKLSEILSKSDKNFNEVVKMNVLNNSLNKLIEMATNQNTCTDNFINTKQSGFEETNFEHFVLLQEENKTLLNKIEELNNKLKHSEDDIKVLIEKNEKSENLRLITSSLQEDKKMLLKKVSILEIQLQQADSFKEENIFFFNKIRDLELELDTLTNVQDENNILKEQLLGLGIELKKTEILEEELELSFKIMENENYQLSDEIKKTEIKLKEIAAIEEENTILYDKVVEEELLLEEIQLLGEECEFLFSKIKEFEIYVNNCASKQNANELLLEKVQVLEKKLDTTTKKYNELQICKQDFDFIQNENKLFKEQLCSFKQIVENNNLIKKENSILTEKLKNFEAISHEAISLKETLQLFEKRIEQLHFDDNEKFVLLQTVKELESVNDENTILKQEIKEYEQTMQAVSVIEADNSVLWEHVKELETVNLEFNIIKQKVQHFDQTVMKINTIENENLVLSEQLKKLDYVSAENLLLKCKLQELDETVEIMTATANENKILSEQLKKLESVNEENTLLKHNVQEFEKTIEKFTVMENENLVLSEQLKDLESTNAENNKLKQKIQECEILIEKMTEIENENSGLSEQLRKLESTIAENITLKQKVQECEKLIENMTEMETEIAVLSEQLKNLESTNAENITLKQKIQECEQLIEKMTEMEKENSVMSEQLKKLKSMNAENIELKQKIQEFEQSVDKMTEMENENSVLSEQLRKLESTNAENITLKQKVQECEKLIEKMTEMETEIAVLSEQLKNLESTTAENITLKQKRQECEQLIEKMTEMEKENSVMSEQLKNLKSMNAENIELKQKVQEFEQSVEKMTEMEKEKSVLSKQLKNLESTYAENIKRKILDCEQLTHGKMTEMENKNAVLSEQLMNLESTNTENITQKIHEFEQLAEKMTKMQNENSVLSEQVKNLESVNTEIIVFKQKFQKFEQLIQKMTEMENENLLLSQQLKEMEFVNEENTTLKHKLLDLEENVATLTHKNNSLVKELGYFKKEKKQLRGLVDEIEANIENTELLREKNSTLCNKVKTMESELENMCALKQSLTVKNVSLTEKFEQILEKLILVENENSSLTEELKDYESMKNEMEFLKEKLAVIENQVIERISNNESEKFILYEKEIESVNKENEILKAKLQQLEQMKQRVSLIETEYSDLSEKFESVRAENILLKQSIKEYEKTNDKIIMIESEKSVLSEKIKEFESVSTQNALLKQKLKDFENVQKYPMEGIEEEIVATNQKEELPQIEHYQCKCNDIEHNLKVLIIQEIFSLNPKVTGDLLKLEIKTLFKKLLEVFVEKEQELVLALQDNFQNQLQGTQENIKQMKIQEERLKRTLGEYEIENEKLLKELSNSENKLELAQSQLPKFREHQLQESENNKTTNDDIENLKRQVDNHVTKLSELNDILKTKETLIFTLSNQITDLSGKNSLLSETVAVEQSRSIEFSQIISKLNEDLKLQELNLNSFSVDIKQKDMEIVHFKTLIANIENEKKIHDSELDEVITNLKSENLLIGEECTKLCEHLRNNSCNLASTLKNIINNFTLLKSMVALFTERIMEEDDQYKSQIENLRTSLKEKDILYNDLKAENNDLNVKLSLRKECDDNISTKLEEEVKHLNIELERKTKEYSEVCLKLKEKDTSYKQLEVEIDQINDKNKELQNKLSNELQTKDFKLKSVLSELKMKEEECSQVSIKFKELEDRLQKATVEISNYIGESVKMCKEIENLNALYKIEKQQNKSLALKIESLVEKNNDLNSRNAVLDEKLNCGVIDMNENHELIQKINRILQTKLCSADDIYSVIRDQIAAINELKKSLCELKEENMRLSIESNMMKGYLKQKEIELEVILGRENKLKEKYDDLLLKFNTHKNANIGKHAESTSSLQKNIQKNLAAMFPGMPTNLHAAVQRIKEMNEEVVILKNKILELQEDKKFMDKECDDMYGIIQSNEKEMGEILRREQTTETELKRQLEEAKLLLDRQMSVKNVVKDFGALNTYEDLKGKHEEEKEKLTSELKSVGEQLEKYKEERETLNNEVSRLKQQSEKSAICECEQLKSQISEMKVSVADKNAKITTLELQIERENYSKKKQNQELEQAKIKIKDLKFDFRRYQLRTHEASVYDCQKCRIRNERQVNVEVQTPDGIPNPRSCVEGHGMLILEEQLRKANKEIYILKKLCRHRNAQIAELQQATGKPNRSVLKENMTSDENVADQSPKPTK